MRTTMHDFGALQRLADYGRNKLATDVDANVSKWLCQSNFIFSDIIATDTGRNLSKIVCTSQTL